MERDFKNPVNVFIQTFVSTPTTSMFQFVNWISIWPLISSLMVCVIHTHSFFDTNNLFLFPVVVTLCHSCFLSTVLLHSPSPSFEHERQRRMLYISSYFYHSFYCEPLRVPLRDYREKSEKNDSRRRLRNE